MGGSRFRPHGGTPGKGLRLHVGWAPHGWDPCGASSGPRRGERGAGGRGKNVPPVPHHGGIPSPWRPGRNRTAIVWRRGPVPGLSPPGGTRGGTRGRRQCPGRGLGVGGPRVVPRLRTWDGVRGAGRGCAPHVCATHGVGLDWGWAGGMGGTRSAPCDCSPAPQPGDGDAVREVGRGWRQGCGIQAGMRDAGRNVGQGWRQGCRMRDEGCGQGCGIGMWDRDKGCRQSW